MSEPQRDWRLGDFDKEGGYDNMTAGIMAGPALLDGAEYGQREGYKASPKIKARMIADAQLIVAAPAMLKALFRIASDGRNQGASNDIASAAIYMATGGRAGRA